MESNSSHGKSTLSAFLNTALLALPWLGVQAIWATEFGVLTGVLGEYGVRDSLTKLAWIFGPITGFFVAPLVGCFSDSCTSKYGRRRPFIVGGLVSTIVFSLIFAFSSYFTQDNTGRAVIAFLSFVGLDITINIMQTPLRALGSDLAPLGYQESVQLFAAFFQGLGGIVGGFIYKYLYASGKYYDLPRLFLTVMALNIALISVICFVIKEEPYVLKDGDEKPSLKNAIFGSFRGVMGMKRNLFIICLIEVFSWAALFAWWPSASTWFKINVYKGCDSSILDGNCPIGSEGDLSYVQGNDTFANSSIYANLLQTVLSLLLSIAISWKWLKNAKYPYAACLGVGSVILILSKLIPLGHEIGLMIAILMAVPISAIQSFPFAIVGNYNKGKPKNETGLQMGILNIFICAPQIVITFVISALTEKYGNDGIPWTLFVCGFLFGLGAITCLFIQEQETEQEDLESKKE